MKILFITDNFPPEVNAPASRTHEHCKRWVSQGATVTVITCAPNFPRGEVHAGYRNGWRSVETIDGIRVVRVKSYITGNEGFSRRILDYVSFMFTAVFFGLFEKRPDVIIGTSPQFFAAVGAWILSVLRWRPFIFELRDLWPASIVTVGAMKKGTLIRALEMLELFLYRRASAIVSVTESFVDDLESRGIDRSKIFVVRNGVDLDRFSKLPKSSKTAKELDVDGKFVIAYLGTHGMAHALSNVLRAADKMRGMTNIVFLFVGDGAEKLALQKLAGDLGLPNVRFHESVQKERMPEIWSITDVALVHLKDDPVFASVIPSKVFEAFGVGKPVMVVQPDGEAAEIVRNAGAGEWVQPENPDALSDAIFRWAKEPDLLLKYSRAAELAAREYSRDTLAAEMLRLIKATAKSK
jgi:glycosyltransferase involved in cell wall biosynthesis